MSLRSITDGPAVKVERLNDGNPVLEAMPESDWESRVVLNPAAILLPADPTLDGLMDNWSLDSDQKQVLDWAEGACVMIYRAQGPIPQDSDVAPSSLGLAVLTPDLELVKRWPTPIVSPDENFHNLGVEDPRVTWADGAWHMYYAGYSGDPRAGVPNRRIQICHAETTDFINWSLSGPITGQLNSVPNKNAALLPSPVRDRWILLHRPMEGPDAMAIHLAASESPAGPWEPAGVLFKSYVYQEFERSWVGAGGPPIHLDGNRFLMIYHQGHFDKNGRREYDLAAALLDLDEDDPVMSRIEPLMRPTGDLERSGDPEVGVDNVLFTCANYVFGDDLIIPYAGADSRIFGASVPVDDLLSELDRHAG
ncbi:MAG: glycosidase [Rhodothermales bacterium]